MRESAQLTRSKGTTPRAALPTSGLSLLSMSMSFSWKVLLTPGGSVSRTMSDSSSARCVTAATTAGCNRAGTEACEPLSMLDTEDNVQRQGKEEARRLFLSLAMPSCTCCTLPAVALG